MLWETRCAIFLLPGRTFPNLNMPMRHILWLMLLLLGLGACDSGGDRGETSEPPSLSGSWRGEVTVQGVRYTYTMTLLEANTQLTGTGTAASSLGTSSYSVRGSHLFPAITVQLTYANQPPQDASGTVSGNRNTIQLNVTGNGFGGELLELQRQ